MYAQNSISTNEFLAKSWKQVREDILAPKNEPFERTFGLISAEI